MMVTLHCRLEVAHVLADAALGNERFQVFHIIPRFLEIYDGLIDSRVVGAGDVVLIHGHRQ